MFPRSARGAAQCYALVVPGIEDLAASELESTGARVNETLRGFDKRDSIVMFTHPAPERSLKCALLEDAFVVALDAPTPRGRSGANRLAATIEPRRFEAARLMHHALRPKQRGRSYKVVVRVAGKHDFRREDAEAAIARAVGRLLPHWLLSREAAALELWVHVIGERTIAGLRLSGDELAQRKYKHAHLPASLKPTVARALVNLSEPAEGDRFLDPMLGAGTILRERSDAARSALLLGGDNDGEAVAAARQNAGRAVAVACWDATKLPLGDRSVDVIVTNPPYGRRHGEIAGIGSLYRKLAMEFGRVLRPDGRCVVLTGEPEALTRALPAALKVRQRRRLLLRGLPVTAFVIVRL
jgi:23S rRNA G2445 N2-methylase RlmL